MDEWLEIRRRVLVEGVSKRQILRETGMHWKTLKKILFSSSPPGYRRTAMIRKPKIDAFVGRIIQILKADKEMPRNQRHTAKMIWRELEKEGFTGRYTIVKDAVRELKDLGQEVFMPLTHRPGEAQVDFGYALVKMAGILRKVAFFVLALPHSDAFFVTAFERECTETFWEGHVRAFEFFGGVPWRITYDNTKVCISKIIGPRARKLTEGFKQLLSHYLFDPHFCLVRRANEKGVVEGTVKFARLNFFVPVPQVRDFAELNAHLRTMCREDLERRLWGKKQTKAQLLEEDRVAFRPLPQSPLEACRIVSTIANSESLVRFDCNDYSVPVEYAHHPVVAKGYVAQVVIGCQQKVIAQHARCWDKERQIFDPRHYLLLAEHKPGSLDHALPMEELHLPECFQTLRSRLEAEREDGQREYIRVLRLWGKHSLEALTSAVEKGLRMRAHSRDAIAQFLLPQEPWEQTTFRLDGREHLRQVKVAVTDIRAYAELLGLNQPWGAPGGGEA
jgi:transposase